MALTNNQLMDALESAYKGNKNGGWTFFLFNIANMMSQEEIDTLVENGWIRLNDDANPTAYTITPKGKKIYEDGGTALL